MMRKTIGKGCQSLDLYIFKPQISIAITCSQVSSPFGECCQLIHPSISVLKNLYPQSNHLSSLDCELCQFAKFRCLSLYSRVNK